MSLSPVEHVSRAVPLTDQGAEPLGVDVVAVRQLRLAGGPLVDESEAFTGRPQRLVRHHHCRQDAVQPELSKPVVEAGAGLRGVSLAPLSQ